MVRDSRREQLKDETTVKCPACSGEMIYTNNHWVCTVCNEEVED